MSQKHSDRRYSLGNPEIVLRRKPLQSVRSTSMVEMVEVIPSGGLQNDYVVLPAVTSPEDSLHSAQRETSVEVRLDGV